MAEVRATASVRPFSYISPSSLHLEDLMQQFGGNVRRTARIMAIWAENCVSGNLENAHFRHIAARVLPCAANAGNCTEKAMRTGRADLLRAQKGLTGASTLCGRAAVRPSDRRGEPLPEAGSEVACTLGHYRRRAVGEPLRADGLPREL